MFAALVPFVTGCATREDEFVAVEIVDEDLTIVVVLGALVLCIEDVFMVACVSGAIVMYGFGGGVDADVVAPTRCT